MHPTQTWTLQASNGLLKVALLTLTLCLAMTSPALCQGASPSMSAGSAVQPAKAGDQKLAFPSNMILVGRLGEEATVEMGVSADRLYELGRKLYPYNHKYRSDMMRRAGTELGHYEVKVAPFFLARHPVTNREYEAYLNAKKGTKRYPFHWWRYANDEEYFKEHRAAVKKRAELERELIRAGKPGQPYLADLFYWLENWKDLKHSVPEGQEDFPVVFVSYRDVLSYCGWAGMRPPSEAEWTLAATGGKRKNFIFGDEWQKDFFKKVGLEKRQSRSNPLPVGRLGMPATGPYGHVDMILGVWELTTTRYLPQADRKKHDAEWERLRKKCLKDKDFLRLKKKIPALPPMKMTKFVAKGGSFYSASQERLSELRVSVRAGLDDAQTLEGLGFRAAKSLRVAVDMAFSRLRYEYNSGEFLYVEDQAPNLARVDGIERYDLDPSGKLIKGYDAVVVAPLNFLVNSKKRVNAKKIMEDSRRTPQPVGVLISTKAMVQPKLKAGIYTIYYRAQGMPAGLPEALKEAERVFLREQAERDRAAKAKKSKKKKDAKAKKKKDKKKKSKKGNKSKDNRWRATLARYGITIKDFQVADGKDKGRVKKGANRKIDYIYLRHSNNDKYRLRVRAPHGYLLLRSNAGEWMTTLPYKKLTIAGTAPENVMLEPTAKGAGAKQQVTFDFAVSPSRAQFSRPRGKVIPLQLKVVLDQAATGPGSVWRTNHPVAKKEKPE